MVTDQKCTACQGESPNGFLCGRCVDDLQTMLGALVTGGPVTETVVVGRTKSGGQWRIERTRHIAGLLEHLEDAAVGRVRLGAQGRHTRTSPAGLNGDDHPIVEFPDDAEDNLEKARVQRPTVLRRRLLAAGRVNERASTMLADLTHTLQVWAGGLATLHGTVINPINPLRVTARDYAGWLAANTGLIARDEDAGVFLRQIRTDIRRIESVINRPVPPRECGPCPTVIDEGRKGRRRCATRLLASRTAIEITCESCGMTYNIERLMQRLLKDFDELVLTRSQIIDVLPQLSEQAGMDCALPAHRFDYWRAKKRIVPVGWWTPGDPIGATHDIRRTSSDRPAYRVQDVRRLLDTGPKQSAS